MQTISVYALLQGVCVHPGACKKTGLRAVNSRPYPVRFKIWERLQNRTRHVGVANLATRWHEVPPDNDAPGLCFLFYFMF